MGSSSTITAKEVLRRAVQFRPIGIFTYLKTCTIFGVLFLIVQTGGQSISTSCLPGEVQTSVKQSFQKLTPTFSPNGFYIQFKTDARISLNPMNPLLVQFLVQYYFTAVNRMCEAKTSSSAVRSGMILNFNAAYEDFLSRIGLPMSCISYYVGKVDKGGIENLQRLYESLSHKSGIGSTDPDRVFTSILGKDLAKNLGMYGAEKSQPKLSPKDFISSNDKSCDKVFWEMKDGSVRANLPSLGPLLRKIRFPTTDKIFNADQGNMTYRLQSFWSQTLSCLKNNDEKANFTFTISQWISTKLFPQLMKSSHCVKGFPGILKLMISLEDYESSLRSLSVKYPIIQTAKVRQRDYSERNNDYDAEYFQQAQPLVADRQEDINYFVDPEHLKQEATTEKPIERGVATASGAVVLVLFLILIMVFVCVYCCLDPNISMLWLNYFAMIKEKFKARSALYRSEYADKNSLLKHDELDLQINPVLPKTNSKPHRRRKAKQKCQKIEISGLPCRSQDEISIAITSCEEDCMSGELQFGESSASGEVSSNSSSEDENQVVQPSIPEYKREYYYTRKVPYSQDTREGQRRQSHGENSEDSSSWRYKRYNEQPWENSDSNRSKYGAVVEKCKDQKYLIMSQHVKSKNYDQMIANWKQTYPTLKELNDYRRQNESFNEYIENLGPPPPPRKPRHRQSH